MLIPTLTMRRLDRRILPACAAQLSSCAGLNRLTPAGSSIRTFS
jgi:hypothetical protein